MYIIQYVGNIWDIERIYIFSKVLESTTDVIRFGEIRGNISYFDPKYKYNKIIGL